MLIKVTIKENSLTIKFTGKENMYGIKIDNMKVIGNIIECTEKEKSHGLMVDHTKANINMTRNTVLGLSIGQTEENTLDIGKMVNNMDEDNIYYPMVKKR